MRKRIFEIIEKSNGNDKLSSIYDGFMLITILLSLIPITFKNPPQYLLAVDRICASIFIIDYFLRLITADYKFNEKSIKSFIKYPFSFMAIVDIVSILPSVITINQGLKTLRLFRITRAFRVFRVFKAFRYSKSVERVTTVLKNSTSSLSAVGTLAISYILISALIIFNIEPDSFNNFYDAIYWAAISLTTVGYGDIYPITNTGKLVSMISSLFGIAIVALPSGIITAGYLEQIKKEKEQSE